ncbi:MAG: MBL fold metallo-hydrolase [Actinobacteria bacterium]|nr:MAG: MBL fold metallo-hydrolase [Actinomycetota bacterium]TMM10945.1 MAG: MBL fold metallo-hydrolase [Actinomycetota bacterium]
MRIRFWGVRGSIPAPGPNTTVVGGNTPCVQVTGEDGTELILDAGSGIRELHASDVGHAKRIHILLTHLHLDHIHGLLFFRPLFDPEAEVTVWGPPGRASLRSRLARFLSSPLSPVEIRDLPANVAFKDAPSSSWRLGELEVRASLIAHRGPTLGYRIAEAGATLSYLPDHEPGLGTSLSSAPSNWISGLALARAATALIHDSQYSDSEYAFRRGWGHSSLSDALAFARRSGPKALFMFHHDPGHDDGQLQSLAHQATDDAARLGVEGEVQLAREGETFDL